MSLSNSETSNSENKYLFFKKSIELEAKESPFLNIGGINKDFLTGEEPKPTPGDWPRSRAMHHMIKYAIWQFYQVFNVEQYKMFQDPEGVLTDVIWAKFRALYRVWNILHSSSQRVIKANMKALRDSERANAYIKRQQKERQQMLIMGGGDLEKGRQKFIQRMHAQKSAKLNKVNEISLSLEKDFSDWLRSDEAKEYTKPMECKAPKQFNKNCRQTYKKESHLNLKVKNISGLINALEQLSRHKYANTITIYGVLKWDEKVAFSTPCPHTCPEINKVFDLTNYGRVYQNQRIKIIGYQYIGNPYIVSSETCTAHRLFPKKFAKLEYRNKRISSEMSVLYNIKDSLSRLEVSRIDQDVKYIMNIDILYNGKETVDINQFFVSHIIRDLMKDSASQLERKKKEREERIQKARLNGLKIQKDKQDILNLQNKNCDSHNVPVLDTPDKIIKLGEMFENGLLDRQQFQQATKKLLINY